jgi:predicted DNA-binding protein
MVRTQVQFTDEQIRSLRRLSTTTGRSVADLVREGVERYITATNQPEADERRKRALRALGRFRSSGPGDVSIRHDHYLAEAFRK